MLHDKAGQYVCSTEGEGNVTYKRDAVSREGPRVSGGSQANRTNGRCDWVEVLTVRRTDLDKQYKRSADDHSKEEW